MNTPNKLTMLRIILIPFFVVFLLGNFSTWSKWMALAIFVIASLTDMLDGYLARRDNLVTNFGKFMDPLADKLTQLTLTICLSLKYPVLYPVLGLFVMKELFQLVLGVVFLRKGKMLPGALMAGKVCTTILFVSLIALVLMPNIPPVAVKAIAVIDALFLIISFVSYAMAYFGKNVKVQDIPSE